MNLELKKYRPIKFFGFVLIIVGSFGFVELVSEFYQPRFDLLGVVFLFVLAPIHFFTGIGVILKKKWGYPLLKLYLYLLLLAVPLGTLLAIKILRYIKDNEIEYFFIDRKIVL
jgi:hypothetical protein